MSVPALLPVILLTLFMSVIGMIWSVGKGASGLTFAIGALYCVFMVVVAFLLNWRAARDIAKTASAQLDPSIIENVRTNGLLMALVYAWGGLAMFGIYTLTPLWWFHSWQYATAMLVIAGGLWLFTALMGNEASVLRRPAVVAASAWAALCQAVAAAVGLVLLLRSSKFYEPGRTDWAANEIFVAGGGAIVCVSLIAAASFWHQHVRSEPMLAPRSS